MGTLWVCLSAVKMRLIWSGSCRPCAPASQSQTSARLLGPKRTSLSSLALQVDNRPAGRPTMKQPLDHRRPAAVTPLPAPPQAAPPLATRGDQRPGPNLSSPSPAAGGRSHEPTAAVLHHEHPLWPLTATPPELNQAAAKQGRPQPDITTTSTKTTNNTRTFGSYTETCMKTTTIRSSRGTSSSSTFFRFLPPLRCYIPPCCSLVYDGLLVFVLVIRTC